MKLALFGMPEAEAAWQSKHSKLCSFYKRYGHTKYLYRNTRYKSLYNWCIYQREFYRRIAKAYQMTNLIPSATHHVVQKSTDSQQVPVV